MTFSATHKPDFKQLVDAIRQTNAELAAHAGRAVNISLTLRNWLIGCHIAEYDLNGADRAKYGDKVLSELATRLDDISNCNRRQLYDYLRFYRTYPQIVETLSAQFEHLLPFSVSAPSEKVPAVSAQLQLSGEQLISRLSYSQFKLLVELDNQEKRAFYEVECIRGNWSVRELKRQINSLYYERSGLSRNRHKLSELANRQADRQAPHIEIRDPYLFEFLGLKSPERSWESHILRICLSTSLRIFSLSWVMGSVSRPVRNAF